MKPSFDLGDDALLVLCISTLLLCGQHAWASDVDGSRKSNAAEAASSSASATSETALGVEGKTEKSGKYDVDRIGQRSIGHGVNLYSLQKERALGESMASAIDRGTRFVADPDINRYVNRLGQKSPATRMLRCPSRSRSSILRISESLPYLVVSFMSTRA